MCTCRPRCLRRGLIIYVMYYAVHYHMGTAGIAATSFALGLLTSFKALMLIGFALVVAGPLGVSFGGIWTAILKLAAIAVFCDGCTVWVEAFVEKFSAGFGGAMISFPVAIGIYWSLLIYLFSMDPGDSWMVVVILSIFDRIVRFVLLMILVALLPSLGSPSGMPTATGAGSSAVTASGALAARVGELKDNDRLIEAKKYISDGHLSGLLLTVGRLVRRWLQACLV